MKFIFYFTICILIFIESSVYTAYPYYYITISFMGYISHKFEEKAIYFNVIIAFFISLYSTTIAYDIMFFILYTMFLNKMFKYILFHKLNILIITFVEILIYNLYVFVFKRHEFLLVYWVKQYIFVFMYNYLFLTFEKRFSK